MAQLQGLADLHVIMTLFSNSTLLEHSLKRKGTLLMAQMKHVDLIALVEFTMMFSCLPLYS